MRHNNRTWFTLLMLTFLGFFASDYPGQSVAVLILAASGAKCSTLSWRFMELRRAHAIWRAALLGLLAPFLIAAVFLAS